MKSQKKQKKGVQLPGSVHRASSASGAAKGLKVKTGSAGRPAARGSGGSSAHSRNTGGSARGTKGKSGSRSGASTGLRKNAGKNGRAAAAAQAEIHTMRNEILGLVLLVFAILCFLGVYVSNDGLFFRIVKDLMNGLFGEVVAYLAAPVLIWAAVLLFLKKREKRVWTTLLLVTCLVLLISVFFGIRFNQFVIRPAEDVMHFWDKLARAFNGTPQGMTHYFSGGFFGALLATPLVYLFATTGAYIVLFLLVVIVLILLTRFSISDFINDAYDAWKGEEDEPWEDDIEDMDEGRGDTRGRAYLEEDPYDGTYHTVYGDAAEYGGAEKGRKIFNKELERPDDVPFDREKGGEKAGTYNFLVRLGRKRHGGQPPEVESEAGKHREIDKDDYEDTFAIPQDTGFADEGAEAVSGTQTGTGLAAAAASRQTQEGQAERQTTGGLDKKDAAGADDTFTISSAQLVRYKFPPMNLLNAAQKTGPVTNGAGLARAKSIEEARRLEKTLESFGVEARVVNVSRGPSVTRYELQPGVGVKVAKIVNLSNDIALNMASPGVRIEAPIPGKNVVGVELANKEKTSVFLKDVLDSPEFKNAKSKLTVALGRNISGDIVLADIGAMPHMLIAGATGSGKSVCINTLIVSLLYRSSPEDVRLLMVDPKVVELAIYNGIPHLYAPVVTEPKKAANLLNWAVVEMDNRYNIFSEKNVRDIKGYNASLSPEEQDKKMPFIVIIIDELADLMMVAPGDVEDKICRLAQKARAAGMHLIVATQRPSVDVITGTIKANIPSRISFAVSSQVDSRTILDAGGAEKLLGKGDMLFNPVGSPSPLRVQCAFISDKEVEGVVDFVKAQRVDAQESYNEDVIEHINKDRTPGKEEKEEVKDELLAEAIDFVIETGHASTSMLQRRMGVGYARAGRMIDQMYARGIIGPYQGSKPREVLISKAQWQEMETSNFESGSAGNGEEMDMPF